MRRKNHMAPARIILIGFALLILAGALLLTLPISTRDGQGAAFFDALFTATSATCVTGLVVQDTALYWSGFGQAVILMLIQIGGMGVVTAAAAISMLAGRRIGLKERWVMQESISAPQVGGIVRRTRFILAVTLVLEGTGTLLLALRFCPEMGLFRGLWYAVFHAVSSFCNAGFDLMGAAGTPFVSLTGYAGDPLVNFTVMGLIVLGGIGFLTWGDVREHKWHLRAYCLQSKLVLAVTAALILLPALFFLLYELRLPQWQTLTLGEKVQGALFQAVTPRTAGYNTLDLSQLSEPSRLLITLLMLVGGSPGSTAGGFKVTTLAVFVLAARAVFRRRADLQCFGRRLPTETLRSAAAVLMMYLGLFLLGGMAICCVEDISLEAALFETASALGTVGLTLGVTPGLGGVSRLILIFLMYFGRVGGLTLIYAVLPDSGAAPAQLPQERVNEALDLVTHAQIGDSTSEAFIASLGVRNFDLCVVAIGDDFQSSLETTALLKEQGARFVLSRAARDVHAKFLLRNGADDVVYPERETASWAAVRYSSDHIFDYIQLTPDHAIYETAVPPAWVGKTIGQLGVRQRHNINILAAKRGEELIPIPGGDYCFREGETMLVLGADRDVQKFLHF